MNIPDDRGYAYHAGIHGLPMPIGCDNAHGTPYFLPWHRAYLYFFERSLRDRLPEVTLTWWDWRTHDIPKIFSQPTDAEGQPNPLHSAAVDPVALEQGRRSNPPVVAAAMTEREQGEPPTLPSVKDVAEVLARPQFLDFSEGLEALHDRVHGWVGGHMGLIALAAYDPIFWAHHTMVDRIWRLWQLRHPGGGPPRTMLDEALPPFRMTVRQSLEVSSLGYEYAASTSSQTVGSST